VSSDQSVRTLSLNATRVGKDNQPDQVLIKTPAWIDRAACGSLGVDAKRYESARKDLEATMPSTKKEGRRFIKKYCRACPVQQECGEYAQRLGIQVGIYGGVIFGRDYTEETA
jgi:hypothetical protein